MRAKDFHSFLQKLDSERYARDFVLFILRWAEASPEDFEKARGLKTTRAIQLSKELFPLYLLENLPNESQTRH